MSDAATRLWRAFRTKPRHEKAIAERIERQEIEIYCPLVETRVQWSDRWKRVKKPLFNGYIFARVDERERITVLEDPSVTNVVMYLGKPGVIRDEEIQAIKFILEDTTDVELVQLNPGQIVKVTHGALKGSMGEVITVSGTKVRVQIQSLGMELVANMSVTKLQALAS